jgi:hypothetical protein
MGAALKQQKMAAQGRAAHQACQRHPGKQAPPLRPLPASLYILSLSHIRYTFFISNGPSY